MHFLLVTHAIRPCRQQESRTPNAQWGTDSCVAQQAFQDDLVLHQHGAATCATVSLTPRFDTSARGTNGAEAAPHAMCKACHSAPTPCDTSPAAPIFTVHHKANAGAHGRSKARQAACWTSDPLNATASHFLRRRCLRCDRCWRACRSVRCCSAQAPCLC